MTSGETEQVLVVRPVKAAEAAGFPIPLFMAQLALNPAPEVLQLPPPSGPERPNLLSLDAASMRRQSLASRRIKQLLEVDLAERAA